MKITFSLAVVLLLFVEQETHAQFSYTTNNGTITILNYTGTNEDVVVPSTIDGLPVTIIGSGAFGNHLSLTNVTIPNSVTIVSDYAFFSCIGLKRVTIPNGVTSIGDSAFYGCSSLNDVHLPDSLHGIDAHAFQNCISLTSITIPDSLAFFYMAWDGTHTFAGCTSLTSMYFRGNAPPFPGQLFDDIINTTVYYLPGTIGWSTNFSGAPTALWTLPYPLVLTGSLGVQANGFSFTVSWATNLAVVVETTTDLGNPVWSPLATNGLSGGTFYFSDPQWTNYPSRFYRVRSQ